MAENNRSELIDSEAKKIAKRYKATSEQIAAELRAAIARRPKLQTIIDDFDTPDREIERLSAFKDAVDETKRNIYNALRRYRQHPDAEADLDGLEEATANEDQAAIKSFALNAMRLHASTAERIDHYAEFFQLLTDLLPQPNSILDLGCGLHPLAYLAFDIPIPQQYVAVDRDHSAITTLEQFAPALLPTKLIPRMADLAKLQPNEIDKPDEGVADIAVLLKLLTVLERSAPEAAARLLDIPEPYMVVTGNVEALTRRDKIVRRERGVLLRLIEKSGRSIIGEIDLPTEFGYILGPKAIQDAL